MIRHLPALLVLILLPVEIHAAERLTLICTATYSHLTNTELTTPHSEIFIIDENSQLVETNVLICKTNLIDYHADESSISFVCATGGAPDDTVLNFEINRYTGDYNTWTGNIHFSGKCRKGEKLF
jgi:hypothetical protein